MRVRSVDLRTLTHRCLCMVLSASMVLGAVPVQSLAEALDDSEVETIVEALEDEGDELPPDVDEAPSVDEVGDMGEEPSADEHVDVEMSEETGDTGEESSSATDATTDGIDTYEGGETEEIPEGNAGEAQDESSGAAETDGNDVADQEADPIAEAANEGQEDSDQSAQPYVLTAQSGSKYGVNLGHEGYVSSINPYLNVGNGVECTWYAWGRAYEKLGIRLNFGVGNAKDWARLASGSYAVDTVPSPNSIMVEDDGSVYGHVYFVENVVGSIVYVTEGNWLNTAYHEDEINLDSWERKNWPGHKLGSISYIHLGQDISRAIVWPILKKSWTGKAVKPTPAVYYGDTKLRLGTDYTLSYENNVDPGTATVIVTGKGEYFGTISVTFKIGPKRGAWRKSGSRWWYQWKDGTYPKSQLLTISGATYYFDASGWMVTGWRKVSGAWYYFYGNGRMAKSAWVRSGWSWYRMDASGKMATGWRTVEKKRYWFASSGVMATGWKRISGKWYYFDSSGAMAKSKWVGYYYVGKSGAMRTSCLTPDGYWVGKDGKWDGKGSIKDAYKAVLKEARKGGVKYGGFELGDTYTMFDVDGDGKPELIVSTADITWGGGNLVFEYRAGKARYLGWCWNSSGGLYGAGKGKLYKLSGRQGGYHVCRVTKSVTTNGSLKETGKKDFVAKSVDEWSDAYNRCHAYCDSLGAKYLTYVSVTNYSLLNRSL